MERLPSERKWRNWQTHQLEGLAVARPWGFESPLPHQLNQYVIRTSRKVMGLPACVMLGLSMGLFFP
jgi:hypothetical protein